MLVFLLYSFVTNNVFAETILNGERFISYVAGKDSRNRVIVEKYNFILSESTRVKLHFISKVRNNVSFKLIETETENTINVLSKELAIDKSPFTQEVDLDSGKYTFIVYKEPSYGSVHNTGKYRFSFDKVQMTRMVPEKTIDKTYENTSNENNVDKVIKQNVPVKDNRGRIIDMIGVFGVAFAIVTPLRMGIFKSIFLALFITMLIELFVL